MLTIQYAKKVFEIAIPYYMYIQRVNFCCNKIPHDCRVFAENYIVCTLSSPMKNEKKKTASSVNFTISSSRLKYRHPSCL